MAITGDFSAAWKIKKLISVSSTWQTLCGADDPLDHIAIFASEDVATLPICIVPATADDGGPIALRRVGLGVWNREGSIQSTICFEIPDSAGASNIEEEGCWFITQTGTIVREIRERVNSKTLIDTEYPIELASISTIYGPARLQEEELVQEIPAIGLSTKPKWIQTIEFTLVP